MTLNFQSGLSVVIPVVILGLLLAFATLIVLWWILALVKKASNNSSKNQPDPEMINVEPDLSSKKSQNKVLQQDHELIAVITAAIAASLNTQVGNLYIKSLRRASAWGNIAKIEQTQKMI